MREAALQPEGLIACMGVLQQQQNQAPCALSSLACGHRTGLCRAGFDKAAAGAPHGGKLITGLQLRYTLVCNRAGPLHSCSAMYLKRAYLSALEPLNLAFYQAA